MNVFQKRSPLSLQILFLLWVIPAILPATLSAQGSLPQGDAYEHYYRILQISGVTDDHASFTIRLFQPAPVLQEPHPWQSLFETDNHNLANPDWPFHLYAFEPVWFQSYNTARPRGGQDGAIWQGKGYNTALSAGFYAKTGRFHLTFRPQVGIAQNLFFDLGPYDPPNISTRYYSGRAGEYAYRGFRGLIDQPVRFGPDSYSWFSLGESALEFRLHRFSAALSNQRIWSGPGVHNSLQFGYNAPGFLHLRLGTYRPWETAIGNVEVAYIFGGVRKSDFYDENVRDTHSVNSLMLSYSPRFAPGLSVGAIRTFFHRFPADFAEYWDQSSKIFEAAVRVGLQSEENPSGYDPDNQIASVFARWVFPEPGFELYAEYGRNDHNVDLRDFRAQPNHHRAYILGMLKSMDLPKNRLLAVGFEMMQSETPRASLLRGGANLGGWYAHAQQVVGFTNRGQIMGTAYGPGANVQMINADLYDQQGRLGFTLARIVYHNSRMDQHFTQIQAANERIVERWEVRNVELMVGIRATLFARYGIEMDTAIEQSIIFNEYNLAGNDLGNTRFELVLRKQINGWLR